MRLIAPFLLATHLIVLAVPEAGASIVAPSALANAEGNTNYLFFGPITFQQLYGVTQLNGLSTGDQITAMQFRRDGGQPTGPTSPATVSNFEVYLGPSNFPVGSLSNSLAANQGAGTTLVRSGALTIPALSFPGDLYPNQFGLSIPFTTPYTYNGGNLLVTISYTENNNPMYLDVGRLLTDVEAAQGEYRSPLLETHFLGTALVIRFTTTPLPEPSSLFHFVAAMCWIGTWYRNRAASKN